MFPLDKFILSTCLVIASFRLNNKFGNWDKNITGTFVSSCFMFSLASSSRPNILFWRVTKLSWYEYDIYERHDIGQDIFLHKLPWKNYIHCLTEDWGLREKLRTEGWGHPPWRQYPLQAACHNLCKSALPAHLIQLYLFYVNCISVQSCKMSILLHEAKPSNQI